MKRKNCKITIEYMKNDSLYPNIGTTIREYTFNDYRICNAVMILLDNINSKWIRKKNYYINPPSEDFMNRPE